MRLIGEIFRLVEEIFEAVEQKWSRKYAYTYAERLFRQPVLALDTRAAPGWTACGGWKGNQ
jgi:hypothetical protein